MANLYLFSNLKTPVELGPEGVPDQLALSLALVGNKIIHTRIVKESVDARKKPHIFFVRQVEFETAEPLSDLPNGVRPLERSRLDINTPSGFRPVPAGRRPADPVVVIGAGPAGLFAALALGEAGLPTILLERGKPVETRMKDIGQLRSHGTLDPESNICFGEGGAGAYTDGKLYTRIKHPFVAYVMKRLVGFDAPAEILTQAHPHLGTDTLLQIIKNMRRRLIDCDVEIRFQTRVERLLLEEGLVRGVRLADGTEIACSRVVLAIGHSARDTLQRLHADGVGMEAKAFAVGVRAEHPQALINANQFGLAERHPRLGAAAYQLTYQYEDEHSQKKGVYSFCMCPGGFIVPSPTEPAHAAVNGMSNANRSTAFANSGIVVQVTPQDLSDRGFGEDPLVGIRFQRYLEARTFKWTKQPHAAPAMRINDFVAKKASGRLAPSNFRPNLEACDLWQLLPLWIAQPIRLGLLNFENKIKGYTGADGNILAIESRTSSPVRIPRGPDSMAVNVRGLYPVGEGAGYAGGIVSAAVDGLKAAEAILAEANTGSAPI